MTKLINQKGKALFQLTTENVARSQIILDFNPLIRSFNLSGNFCLLHWQSRPRGYRQWGIYSSRQDLYFSVVDFFCGLPSRSLQIDDQKFAALPSAVIYYPNSFFDSDRGMIEAA